MMPPDRNTKRRRELQPEDAANIGTMIARLVREAAYTRLRLDTLEALLLKDPVLKQEFFDHFKERLDRDGEALADRLVLSEEAYAELHPDVSNREERSGNS